MKTKLLIPIPHGGNTACLLIIWLFALILGPRFALAQGSSPPLLTTITNPAPVAGGGFGASVTAVGSDRVLIGANNAARAYLFNVNGTLLTTFTNPTPANFSSFGYSAAVVGSSRVLIGAPNDPTGANGAGSAYLFSTNGTLLTTFTNPIPALNDNFGWSMAAVGSDRVLIGAIDPTGTKGTGGSAYLFSTNGTLLTTFTNPTPANFSSFGYSAAVVGSDRVLIGAIRNSTGAQYAGSAYLFNTSGTLLTTFNNPVPAFTDWFGWSVAAVGSDRVLIGAVDYHNVKGTGGSAYLFSTNGALLSTFTNPTPAANNLFGGSVAAVGSSRVLIGSFRDGTGAPSGGSAYLFSTNGTLLNTITNPTPAANDSFGYSVAAIGTDQIIIGAQRDDTGATDAGSAYLFALPYPPLNIARDDATVSVGWVTAETGLLLQQADLLGAPTMWSNTIDSVSIRGGTNVVQQTVGITNRFFRLRRP